MYLFVGRDRTSRPEKFLFNVVINSMYMYIFFSNLYNFENDREREGRRGNSLDQVTREREEEKGEAEFSHPRFAWIRI